MKNIIVTYFELDVIINKSQLFFTKVLHKIFLFTNTDLLGSFIMLSKN